MFWYLFYNVVTDNLYLYTQWFEEKQQQIETLDQQLKKLHQCVEILVTQRKGTCIWQLMLATLELKKGLGSSV